MKGSGNIDRDGDDSKVACSKLHISAATNTGNYSAAEVTGRESIAIVTGKDSKAKGGIGCWIVLTERGEWDGNVYPIKEVKAVRVDGEIIKPDTYYKLINGEVIPCE